MPRHVPSALLTLALALLALAAAACSRGASRQGEGGLSQLTDPRAVPTATLPPNGLLPTPIPVGAMPSGPSTQSPGSYRVQSGDTLGAIAARLGVPLTEIVRLNPGIDPSHIFAGQEIKVPTKADVPASPTPTPASRSSTGTPTPQPTVSGGQQTYKVQSGDSACAIALRYKVSVTAIAQANNTTVDALRSLQVGQTLIIPPSQGGQGSCP